mgnify:CR=1 FL=1
MGLTTARLVQEAGFPVMLMVLAGCAFLGFCAISMLPGERDMSKATLLVEDKRPRLEPRILLEDPARARRQGVERDLDVDVASPENRPAENKGILVRYIGTHTFSVWRQCQLKR